jgi:coiled-coil domain-containing protein 130
MQGFNMGRYYPPDEHNAPSFNRTSHPLGARAKNIKQGVLTVRFELPFAVWCTHCKPEAIVGQGVRFNAEKKKVGNYYSTPIWSFRMKHTACGGWWEIRTDPKTTEYIVAEGARRRDYGPDEVKVGANGLDGELSFLTEEEKERRREDAFAGLEGRLDDKSRERRGRERVEELLKKNERDWEDPWAANQKLRAGFRAKRKVWKEQNAVKGALQDKLSFGYEVVEESEMDKMKARLVEFGGSDVADVTMKPLFDDKADDQTEERLSNNKKKLKSEVLAEKSRKDLHQTLIGNTRAAVDPFLMDSPRTTPKPTFGVLKRKRIEESDPDALDRDLKESASKAFAFSTLETMDKKTIPSKALVDYDSD